MMWTRPRTILGTGYARLMAQFATFRMIAADFAGLRARRTGHAAVAWSFAAMAAGRVWSSTLGVTNSMFFLNNRTVNPDTAIFASMRAVMSTSQCRSAGCRTGVINIQRQFVTMDSDSMFAMLHDLSYLDPTANFLWYLRLMTSQLPGDVSTW
jgi:hypothetical protein